MDIHTVETLGLDRVALFPKYHDDVENGRSLLVSACQHELAQDRVAMRRTIRKRYPELARALNLRRMDSRELSAVINELDEVFPQ